MDWKVAHNLMSKKLLVPMTAYMVPAPTAPPTAMSTIWLLVAAVLLYIVLPLSGCTGRQLSTITAPVPSFSPRKVASWVEELSSL